MLARITKPQLAQILQTHGVTRVGEELKQARITAEQQHVHRGAAQTATMPVQAMVSDTLWLPLALSRRS